MHILIIHCLVNKTYAFPQLATVTIWRIVKFLYRFAEPVCDDDVDAVHGYTIFVLQRVIHVSHTLSTAL